MRIRTTKPEFWAHPVMARQSDATKLLALGLLNLADDEGYFFADAALVRAALRPLDEDSTIIRRGLDDLSRTGYVAMREHSTHGYVGQVVAFVKHQRVDRPSPSKIRPLFESGTVLEKPSSTNIREILDEPSTNVRCGIGKDQGEERKGSLAPAPAVASEDASSSFALEKTETAKPPAKTKRPRNENFDALASLNGSDPTKLTKSGQAAVATALAQIVDVHADLAPSEIKRRAEHYRLRFPNATITPNALAKHWADLEHPPAPKPSANGRAELNGALMR